MATTSRVLKVALPFAIVALFAAGLSAQRPAAPGKRAGQARAAEVQKRKGITEAQKANVRDRVAIATRILDKHQAEAEALGMPDDWRRPLYETLLPLSPDTLLELEGAESLQAMTVAAAAIEPMSLGSSTEDLVYTPITPCRYIDTRQVDVRTGTAARVYPNRGYDLARNGAAYGGSAACAPMTIFGLDDSEIPALVMNMTIVYPTTAPGHLTIKPTLSAPTTSWMNWYSAGPNVQLANMGIATLDMADDDSDQNEFWMETRNPVNVVVDISGAFLPPEATAVETSVSQSTFICPAGQFCSTDAVCPAGWSLTGGGLGLGAFVAGFDIVWNGPGRIDVPGFDAQIWKCQAANASATSQTMYCSAVCTRTPGR